MSRGSETAENGAAPGFHTITLGCKLNQFDTAAIEGELVRRGYRPARDPADAAVVVLNTCTVTANADGEARKRIRQVRRANPSARLLVTGCYAERDRESVAALAGVDHVFGNRDKPHLARILDELGLRAGAVEVAPTVGLPAADRGCDGALELPRALHFGDRSRAFLKVQEGCRLACTYCVIPAVRGPSRSVPPADVEAAARSLAGSGYREIVLTGVNTGDFGRDLVPATNLAALLRRLIAALPGTRLRLNSLEPLTVTDEIVELLAREERLAPHLQVPLQSGSNEILRRMRRNYRVETYLDTLERLRAAVPDIGLGADVIVGFPGETDERFEASYERIASSPLSYLHVFPWSARPGTPAASLDGTVAPAEQRRRGARLRGLAGELSYRFRRRFLGRELDVLVLASPAEDGRLRALSGNFIEVRLAPDSAAFGALVRVEVTDVARDETGARACGRPVWA